MGTGGVYFTDSKTIVHFGSPEGTTYTEPEEKKQSRRARRESKRVTDFADEKKAR